MSWFGEFALVFLVSVAASLVTYVIVLMIVRRPGNAIMQLLENRWWARRWPRLVSFLFCASAVFCTLALITYVTLGYYNFNNGGNDLAIFDQVIWNSMHGRLFESSVLSQTMELINSRANHAEPKISQIPQQANELGNHFAPILLALVPAYAILNDPNVLRVVQTLAMVGAVFPLFWFARARVGNLLALVISIAFLTSPVLPIVNGFDFHEIPLATTLLALALFFLLRRKDLPFLVCVFLALLVKEDVSFIVVEFGLFMLWFQRRRLFGLGVSVVGTLWAIVVVQWVMPHFSTSGMLLGALYPALGRNLSEIVQTIITRPLFIIQYVWEPARIAFLLHLLVPLAFVPILGGEVTAFALAPLMESMLSGNAVMYQLFFWYTTSMMPFVFFGAVLGMQRLLTWKSGHPASEKQLATRKLAFAVLVLTASSMTYYLYSPLPFARNFDPVSVLPDSRSALGHNLLAQIPAASVASVTIDLLPHVSQRRLIYIFPYFPDYRQLDDLVLDTTRPWNGFDKGAWERMLETGYFKVRSQQDGYVLATRTPLEHSLHVQFDDKLSLLGYTIPLTQTLRGGQVLRPILGWTAEQAIQGRYLIQMHLLDQQGHLWSNDDREPQDGASPTSDWTVGNMVGDQYALNLPSTMPPGDYTIMVGVYDPVSEHQLIANAGTGLTPSDMAAIAHVYIEKDKSNITATQLQERWELGQPFFVDMGEMRLIGYEPFPRSIIAGDRLSVGLIWRARGKPQGDYAVSVELRDAAGHIVLEQKDRPAAGAYPTTLWDAGEVLLDWHDMAIPPSLSPGEYSLHAVISDIANRVKLGEAQLAPITIFGSQ